MQVKFKKLHANAQLPVKGSEHAACFDVYATSVTAEYGGKVTYGLGFATEIPVGYMGILVPRSNITKHKWVMNNSTGIIDSDYRGEWMMKLNSIGKDFEELPYAVGDRIGQIYFIPILPTTFEEVSSLDDSARGEGGFGSTGIGVLNIHSSGTDLDKTWIDEIHNTNYYIDPKFITTTNIADGKINITA